MKRWRHIFTRFLPMLLISLILGGSFWSWNARQVAGNAMPMPFGVGLSVVLSGSMEPALSVGDLMLIYEAEDYSVGDIVVFRTGRSAVVHRLISLDGDAAVTKGDANNTADEPISRSDICGKVVIVWQGIGYVFLALKTPMGVLLTLALAVWMLVRADRKEKKRAEEEQERLREQIQVLRRQIEGERDDAPNEDKE